MPYTKYKPSEIPWLREVPAQWEIRSVKQGYNTQLGKMLQNSARTCDDVQVPYLRAVHVQWFSVNTSDLPTMWASSSELLQYGTTRGDLLVCEGGEGGRSGIVDSYLDSCIIQNALHRVRTKGSGHNRYLQYVMYVAATRGWLDALNSKATIAHFTAEKLSAFRIPFPPAAEQESIVQYLDYVDRRIRRFVAGKRNLIALLEEERQAVISRAVTRGLDPDVQLRPSGVECLGDVPAHWAVRKLSHVFSVGSGTTPPTPDSHYYGGDIAWVTTSELRESVLKSTRKTVTSRAMRELPALSIFPVGSVAVAMYGATIGRVGILGIPAAVNQACCVFYDRTETETSFLFYSFRSRRRHLVEMGHGGGQPNLNQEMLRSMRMPIPPIGEQRVIVEFLENAMSRIDAAIERARRQIELLEEYRTRLVADVVTGKLDVREAAAQLPDEDDGELIAKGAASPDDPGSDHDDASAERAGVESGMRAKGQ